MLRALAFEVEERAARSTVAGTRPRRASTVHSISSWVPGSSSAASTEARAMFALRIGLHVPLVARPTCLVPE